MNYNLIKAILSDTWSISPEYFLQYYPIAKSIIRGNSFEIDKEPKESIPFILSQSGYDSRIDGNEKPTSGLISIIPLVGMMLKYDAECGPIGTTTIAKRLELADNDPAVIGHILFTDSGGGQTSSVDPLATSIKNLKKPILGFVNGYMCSAALGVSIFCNEIYASEKHDMIGSVGTMIGFEAPKNLSEDQDGVVTVRVYSDYSPDKNLEFEEALKGNFKVVKDRLLNPLDLKFMNSVREQRKNVKDEHLTGKVYMASEVEGIFIDGIKSFKDVLERVVELSKLSSQTNSNNITAMNKEFKSIESVIGSKLESSDEGVYLNEEQLEKVDAVLVKTEQMETDLNAANAAKTKAESDLAAAQQTIQDKDTEIAGLKKNPGAESGKAISEKETGADPKGKNGNVTSEDKSFMENLEAVEKLL